MYDLTCERIQWEVEPGRRVKAWAYNNQVPGPQIRVHEGDSYHNAAVQVGHGLPGTFIVEPRRPVAAHRADVDLRDGAERRLPRLHPQWHCHILPHAKSEHGMFGVVTALIVQKPGIA